MTVQAGHRHNCWVGICGELGADPTLTETFLRMGLDELSVNPGGILGLRKIIRELDLGAASAPEAASAGTPAPEENDQPKKKFSNGLVLLTTVPKSHPDSCRRFTRSGSLNVAVR